ncbi:MAG: hypothetical protein GDA36_14010, partial [Rhodobacteraceae bacterium]|nr:hypothetical protein [Paracoccaceae bacterium]
LPLVLGSHRIYPDLAAQGYNNFKDHDDYLHQVFGVGLGALDISYIRIGETPADDIPGITTQVLKGVASADGEQAWDVRSHEGAVLTDEPWQEAAQSDTGAKAKWHQWRTAEGSTHVEIDLVVDAYDVTDKGKQVASRVSLRTGYQLGANTLRVYGRSPYRPSRITQRYALRSAGAQDIGLRLLFILRLNTGSIIEDIAKKLRDRETIDVVVRAVRSLRPDEGDYAGQSRLRVAARASERLSGSLERVSMMVANRVSVYDRESRKWAAAASSNPAWLFRYIARGIRVRGRLVAGAHNLACDLALARQINVAELLAIIARCERATPSWAGVLRSADNPAGDTCCAKGLQGCRKGLAKPLRGGGVRSAKLAQIFQPEIASKIPPFSGPTPPILGTFGAPHCACAHRRGQPQGLGRLVR